MNNTFDINRFGLLLRRQWLEFGKIYLMALGVAFGANTIFYLYSFWATIIYPNFTHINLNFREPLFLIFGFLFITAIASNYFSHYGQKAKTVIDLLIPASTFEKFLAAVLFTAVLSVVSFVVIFWLVDFGFITNYRANHGTARELHLFFAIHVPDLFTPLYFVPALATSIFLLGSIYFHKFHYIKTALSVMVFTGLATYIVANAGEALTRNRHQLPTSPFMKVDGKDLAEISISLVLILLTLAIWSITYVRLKEKEV
ncbi:hypothetical protein [Pedobacter deserti]|uniref:hypothetical protein n=1 Tax=Pedobacter deserti TaxID=2817382 RepID=UPI00210AC842|nr:hypothetical protein [Pedobacter sp. SYSU D00382]